jgi:peptidoglycan/LPS O-acetylase OafA/YrhL
MLVLALTMLWRSLERRVFWTVFAGVVLVAGSSHFSLFLFGFFLFHAYSSTKSDKANPLHAGIGALLIMAGLYVCTVKNTALLSATLGTLSHLTWMDASSNFQWQSQVGAMLVFSGVLLTVPAQNWLTRPLAQWLGQVSFSVYLLHFPIMMTVGCAVFAWLPSSYALACALSAFVGIVLTFLLAALFEKFVDRPSVRWSKQLGGGS